LHVGMGLGWPWPGRDRGSHGCPPPALGTHLVPAVASPPPSSDRHWGLVEGGGGSRGPRSPPTVGTPCGKTRGPLPQPGRHRGRVLRRASGGARGAPGQGVPSEWLGDRHLGHTPPPTLLRGKLSTRGRGTVLGRGYHPLLQGDSPARPCRRPGRVYHPHRLHTVVLSGGRGPLPTASTTHAHPVPGGVGCLVGGARTACPRPNPGPPPREGTGGRPCKEARSGRPYPSREGHRTEAKATAAKVSPTHGG